MKSCLATYIFRFITGFGIATIEILARYLMFKYKLLTTVIPSLRVLTSNSALVYIVVHITSW